jgi:hypothetical protein
MWQRSYFDCFEDFGEDDDATEINNTFIVLIPSGEPGRIGAVPSYHPM